MNFICAILFLLVVLNEGLAEECNEDNMKACLTTLEDVVLRQVKGIQKAEKDLSSYCQTLAHEGQCLKDISQSCKADHPKISTLVSAFQSYLSQFCGENVKMYQDIVPCFENHKSAFEECWSHGKSKREEDPLFDICMEAVSMKCVAKLSKEKCKNGEAFGNAVEKEAKNVISVVCSGVCYLTYSFWTIATTILSVLLIKNKL